MEQTPVGARPNLVDNVGLEIDVERAGHVLAGRGFREESAEAIVVGGGRALNKTTIGLWLGLDEEMECKRVETHAKTVLDGVELPCNIVRSSATLSNIAKWYPRLRTRELRVELAATSKRCASRTTDRKLNLQQALPIWTPA